MLRRVGGWGCGAGWGGVDKKTEGGRGAVEVCFVRRLLGYCFFFFFTEINGLEPSPHLPHGSNIYFNVLSINITRLVL